MRLIDADALLENFYKERNPNEGADSTNQRHRYMQFLGDCEAIRNSPTIDAVPVIRCGDCKHFDGYYCHNKWWGDGHGNYTPPIKVEDGFCDWAERKEE